MRFAALRPRAFAFALALGATVAPLYACGDDDAARTPAADGGVPAVDSGNTTPDAGSTPPADSGSAPPDAAADAPSGPPIRCDQADFDKTAGPGGGDFTAFPGADITFPRTAAPAQYTNRCVKVKVGSDITFSGDFSLHPLEPAGGDTPSPIVRKSAGTDDLTFKVPTAGTFGYQCELHPGSMNGAIQVVP